MFDLIFALFLYFGSVAGLMMCMGAMIQYRHYNGKMRVIYGATAFFLLTLYLGGDMLTSMN